MSNNNHSFLLDSDIPSSVQSEAGQILLIYVENFMCHRKFSIDFGRNMNFICGQNGSGYHITMPIRTNEII
jgi:hypothetical protein